MPIRPGLPSVAGTSGTRPRPRAGRVCLWTVFPGSVAHLRTIFLVLAMLSGLAVAGGCRGSGAGPNGDTSAEETQAGNASNPAAGGDLARLAQTGEPRALASAFAAQLAEDPLTLLRQDPPERDLADLAARMGRLEAPADGTLPRIASETAVPRAVGDRESFWVHDIINDRYFEITARLEVLTDAAYFWVQEEQSFDREGLTRGAEAFSKEIYPELRRVFGSEWSPGVDGDARVHVLHHEPIPGVAGFFSSADEYVVAVEPYSNEREMFYVNLSTYAPGSQDYLQLLAHEFQHMIHWHQDRGEPVWVNEGLSELAPYLVGYGRQTGADLIARPDTQLTRWEDSGGNGAHYAGSFLYLAWLWGQHGEPLLKALLAAEGNGEVGIEQALADIGQPADFATTFQDWTVANLIGDRGIGEGRYGYERVSVRQINPRPMPAQGVDSDVSQFGADYWDITGLVEDGALALSFEGDGTVPLLAEGDGSRGNVWWSNRGDDMDSRLTRRFDLSGVSQASLQMRSWWAIEEHWDHGYLLASRDDGATWDLLASDYTTTANPNGNSFGAARTGLGPGWVDEEVDLSAYAGDEVLLRFEMVTDDAVSLAGWAIDELAIDAIGYREDLDDPALGPEGSWQVEGWWPLDPTLPQAWGVRSVQRRRAGDRWDVQVVDHPVTPGQTNTLEWQDVPDDATVTIIVSGLTHATRNSATYRLWSPSRGTPPAGYP